MHESHVIGGGRAAPFVGRILRLRSLREILVLLDVRRLLQPLPLLSQRITDLILTDLINDIRALPQRPLRVLAAAIATIHPDTRCAVKECELLLRAPPVMPNIRPRVAHNIVARVHVAAGGGTTGILVPGIRMPQAGVESARFMLHDVLETLLPLQAHQLVRVNVRLESLIAVRPVEEGAHYLDAVEDIGPPRVCDVAAHVARHRGQCVGVHPRSARDAERHTRRHREQACAARVFECARAEGHELVASMSRGG
eukprot:7385678-Prymnesium_polylepis.3